METKYLFVTGGVISGLGKGLAAASIGKLISPKHKIVPVKCDGYLNVDPGTMNPVEHGEVYVLDDGTEADMDFGHYERFMGISCKGEWNLTMGKVYSKVMEAERRGDYLGKTVQMIPHVVNAITDWWEKIAKEEKAEIMLVEVGGTVGDLENQLYLEAARRLHNKVGHENAMFVHLTYVPVLYPGGEQKSKPTQQSVRMLKERGIVPDMVIARCSKQLTKSIKSKIAMNADLAVEQVVTGLDTDNLFSIPLLFKEEGVGELVASHLGLKTRSGKSLKEYERYIRYFSPNGKSVKVAICGKYTDLDDSYASVVTALQIAGAENEIHVEIDMLGTTQFEKDPDSLKDVLSKYDGIIVPGGWGSRGIEGKIECIKYCRENNIPYLGICYGLQLALVEFARNVCNMDGAHTTEVDPECEHPIVDILPDKKNLKNMGGTLRLGSYPAELVKGSLVHELYGHEDTVYERHRHRYEVNPKYHERLLRGDMKFSGMGPDGRLVEYIELEGHKYFTATQAHPEFKTPAPLFVGFIEACKK